MAKLGRHIIIIVLLCIGAVTFISVGLVENAVKSQLSDSAFKYLVSAADNQAMRFDNELGKVEETTHEIKRLVEANFSFEDFKTQQDYLSRLTVKLQPAMKAITTERAINHSAYVFFLPELAGKSHSIWYADLNRDGELELQEPFLNSYFDGDMLSKQWFYGPILSKTAFWTEPYMGSIAADRNIVYFSYTEPVIMDGKVIAVVGNDYYFNNMKDEIASFKLDGKGYAGLIDKNGKVLIHPTLKAGVDLNTYQNGKYASVYNATQQDASGTFEYLWENNEEKLMVYHRLSNDWTLIAALTKTEINEKLYSFNQIKWLIILVGLLVTFLLLYSVFKRAEEPMKQVRSFLDRLTTGDYQDLTPLSALNRSDEFGVVLRKLEFLRTELKRQSEHFLVDQEQLETLLKDKHDALIKTNEYLELSLEQLRERNDELSLAQERYEGQLDRNEQLARRLYTSEELASIAYVLTGLAFDLNSPVGNSTTIVSYSQNELEQLERKLRENTLKKQDLEDYLAVTKESLKLLERNMHAAGVQLSQFKQLTDGKQLHQQSSFNLKAELSKLYHQLMEANKYQQIRLNLNMMDLHVTADLGAFAQLFGNLLRFSLDYSYATSEKGMIHIRAERVSATMVQIIYEDFGKTTEASALRNALSPHLTTQFGTDSHLVQLNIAYHVAIKIFEGNFTFESVSEGGHKFYLMLKLNTTEGSQ